MSETKEDVRVEKTNPLEGEEGIGGPVEDESGEDEGGDVVEAEGEGEGEGEGVEAMDVNCEVGAAEEKVVAAKIVVEEATAPLVEGNSCEVVGLDECQMYEKRGEMMSVE